MKKKSTPRTKINLFNKAQLFIYLGGFLYDYEDKHRFRKMFGIIDAFYSSPDSENIKETIKNLLPSHFEWRPNSEESFEITKQLYLKKQTKTEQKNTIRFLKATVKLYYKLDEILNRVDVIGVAFILRSSEYDFYLNDMVEDLGIPKLSSVKKIKQYIIDNIVEGNCNSLDDKGYWGRPLNIKYVQSIELKGSDEKYDNDNYENDDYDDTHDWENRPPRRRGPARVRLEERIDWGAEQIHKMLTEYKSKFMSFY
jgi:hypothetical protein